MTIKEAQEAVDKWIKEYGVRYFSELTNMACLTEDNALIRGGLTDASNSFYERSGVKLAVRSQQTP